MARYSSLILAVLFVLAIAASCDDEKVVAQKDNISDRICGYDRTAKGFKDYPNESFALRINAKIMYSKGCDEMAKKNNESMHYVEKIEALNELILPHEWYSFDDSLELPRRWGSVAQRIYDNMVQEMIDEGKEGKIFPPVEDITDDLKTQFNNSRKPFKSLIYLNAPKKCEICGEEGNIFLVTIVSEKKNLFVSVSGEEIHNIKKHGGALDEEKLDVLRKIFG